MNGFEAARFLRDQSNDTRPFLVALTGLAGDDLEARTKACGFDFYMAKPADLVRLGVVVEQLRPGLRQAQG